MKENREELESIKRDVEFDRWLAEKLAKKRGALSEYEIERYKSLIYEQVDSRMGIVSDKWEREKR